MPSKGRKPRKKPTSSTESAEVKRVPIKWVIPPDIKSSYATHMLVQRLEHEVVINFCEVQKPLMVDPPEEVEAKCVSKVIVSLPEMPKFIEALMSIMQPELAAAQEELSLKGK